MAERIETCPLAVLEARNPRSRFQLTRVLVCGLQSWLIDGHLLVKCSRGLSLLQVHGERERERERGRQRGEEKKRNRKRQGEREQGREKEREEEKQRGRETEEERGREVGGGVE